MKRDLANSITFPPLKEQMQPENHTHPPFAATLRLRMHGVFHPPDACARAYACIKDQASTIASTKDGSS